MRDTRRPAGGSSSPSCGRSTSHGPRRPAVNSRIDTLQRLTSVAGLKRAQDHGTYLTVLNPKVRGYKVPGLEGSREGSALKWLPFTLSATFLNRSQNGGLERDRGALVGKLEGVTKPIADWVRHDETVAASAPRTGGLHIRSQHFG